jgi:DNA-binding response OmpR family regulator
MAKETVMVVEDESEIREIVSLYLRREGYSVVEASHAEQAFQAFEEHLPELVLLDIHLPGEDGLTICREIRSCSNVPILFMSCRSEPSDIIHGLELGADDYIPKPFDPAIVVARVKANLRRAPLFRRTSHTEAKSNTANLAFDGLEIDLLKAEVRVQGISVNLSTKEFMLLSMLAQHPGQVFTAEELYKRVWGTNSNGDTRTVLVHMFNLRKKIESTPSLPKWIQNVRGLGYRFQVDSESK